MPAAKDVEKWIKRVQCKVRAEMHQRTVDDALNRAIVWRAGLPAVALLLALLAIPLAYSNPRVGRSGNLIVAVLVFLLYHNGMSIVQAWVQQDRLPFGVGVWLVHGVVAAIVVLLFVRRVYMQRWLPRWFSLRRQRRSPA